jgi:hypothetical protein
VLIPNAEIVRPRHEHVVVRTLVQDAGVVHAAIAPGA